MRSLALLLLGSCLLPACSNVLTRQAPPPSTAEALASVLVMRVNHALMSAQVAGYTELRITATDGDVIVAGTATAQDLIDQVLDIASNLEGVASVTYRAVPPR